MSIIIPLYRQGNRLDSSDYLGANGLSGGNAALGFSAPNGLGDGELITITTDGTYSFGTKANAKPLLFWTADGGEDADLVLGRSNWEAGSFGDSPSTDQVAPNSTQSYVIDHGADSGAALGSLRYNSRDLYVFRKMYTDHTPFYNHAQRIRYVNRSGILNVGDKLTGSVTGATATIASIYNDEAIYCDRSVGTDSVNQNPFTDFNIGELITTDAGASFNANEGSNVPYRTYNYKMIRTWGDKDNGDLNNAYWGPNITSGWLDDPNHQCPISITKEYTDATHQTNGMFLTYKQWESQECFFRSSSAPDVADGEIFVRIKGVEDKETGVITRDSTRPSSYQQLYQTQVSNGMQPNSNTYYDCVYVDDTLHRVVIGDAATWAACIDTEVLIPTSWSTTSIELKVRQGSFATLSGKYLYIFDADGNPISTNGVQI